MRERWRATLNLCARRIPVDHDDIDDDGGSSNADYDDDERTGRNIIPNNQK